MMRKTWMTLMILVAGFALMAAPLSAQEGGCAKKQVKPCAHAKAQKACGMMDTLKLNDGQKAEMERLHAGMQKWMAEHQAGLKKQHEALAELWKKGDAKAVDAGIDVFTRLQAEGWKKRFAHHQSVRALLNEEQKAAFDKMACGMMAHEGSCKGTCSGKHEAKACCGKDSCRKAEKTACCSAKGEGCQMKAKEKASCCSALKGKEGNCQSACSSEKKGECCKAKGVECKGDCGTCEKKCKTEKK